MSAFQQDSAAIDGKTFDSNSLFSVSLDGGQIITHADQTEYRGGPVANIHAHVLQGGTVTVVDAQAGTFSLNGNLYQLLGASQNGEQLFFSPADEGTIVNHDGSDYREGAQTYFISSTGAPPTDTTIYDSRYAYGVSNDYAPFPFCFGAGTRILTDKGEVPIEQLNPGDGIVLQDGRTLPLKWLGHRTVRCDASPWPEFVRPILIARNGFSAGVPSRDLLVSPAHGIAIDAWLFPAGSLVNGRTIRQLALPEISYWHIELDEHAIVLAESLAAETFIDVGNRGEFEGENSARILHARFIAEALDHYCRPVAVDREVIAYFRNQLARRADALAGEALAA